MEQEIYAAVIALMFGGVGGGLVTFFFFRKQAQWESLREAGMNALEVVDAVHSNLEWTDKATGSRILSVKQPVDMALARRALNQLSLTCKDPEVVTQYMNALGLSAPSAVPTVLSGDAVIALRNALRVELGYGKPLMLERARAFIAQLPGANAG